jgi:hypothetical protein
VFNATVSQTGIFRIICPCCSVVDRGTYRESEKEYIYDRILNIFAEKIKRATKVQFLPHETAT